MQGTSLEEIGNEHDRRTLILLVIFVATLTATIHVAADNTIEPRTKNGKKLLTALDLMKSCERRCTANLSRWHTRGLHRRAKPKPKRTRNGKP